MADTTGGDDGTCGFSAEDLTVPRSLFGSREEVLERLGLTSWGCSRPVWNAVDDKRCVWHAEVDNKPPDELNAHINDGNLHGAHVPETDLSPVTFPDDDPIKLTLAVLRDVTLENADLRNANLRGANLRAADLLGADVREADLTGASLSKTNLTDVDLREADMAQANLEAADLTGADLREADLSGARLKAVNLNASDPDSPFDTGANLTEASLTEANLNNARLQGFDLSGADLRDADLSGARLKKADLTYANLSGADLTEIEDTAALEGADLAGANLRGADLTGMNLTNADFSGARLDNATFSRASLNNATFASVDIRQTLLPGWALFGPVVSMELAPDSDATVDLRTAPVKDAFTIIGLSTTLRETTLQGADLEGADLRHADLREATLTSADCEDTRFTNANVTRAGFENVDLTGANLTQAYLYQVRLDGVQINENTQFHPDGDVGDITTGNACRYDSAMAPASAAASITDQAADDEDTSPEEVRARRARSTYTRLEDLARENGFPDLKSEMFVRRQDARRELLWAQGQRARAVFARVQKVLFNYGESFARVVGISALAILIGWVLYMVTGTVETADGTILTAEAVVETPRLGWEALYHSVSIFFAGSGPLAPTGTAGQVLTAVLRATGPILVALLIFVLGRRAAR